jgi:hypothetical protein
MPEFNFLKHLKSDTYVWYVNVGKGMQDSMNDVPKKKKKS